jgi:4-diphosphocytidyl-2-C-methyl-D-erythritol kinase
VVSQQRDNPLIVLAPRARVERLPGGVIRLAAPAKINLDLLVGPRRSDGYHPLDSLVAKVTLYDEITLTPRADGQITLTCRDADCGPAEMNLAYRAAKLLALDAGLGNRGMGVSPVDSAGTNDQHGQVLGTPDGDARATRNARAADGVDIALVKHIPPGKGLGGGSADAAAVLAGLDQLWRLATPAGRLAQLAATLGSDVPLFLGPPAARMTGRGEKLQPLAVHGFAAVLHMPDFACATADVYRALDSLPDPPTGAPRAARPMATREAIDLAANLPSAWRSRLTNDLTAAAEIVNPQLRGTLDRLRDCTGQPVHMTGSGSAMFILCDEVAEAQAVARRLPPDLPGQTVIVLPSPW